MKGRTRPVLICRLPDQFEMFQRDAIRDGLVRCINVDRPAVVIDCSTLSVLDRPRLHLLLCCLEEAMKRNGDVRLAMLNPEVRSVLDSTGVDSLFQCFETVSEAVDSYSRPLFEFDLLERTVDGGKQSEMSAA